MRYVTDHLLIFSGSPEQSRGFYTAALGARVLEELDWGFILLELPDGARIGLMHPRNWAGWEEGQPLPQPVLCLRTDDLQAALVELEAGGVEHGGMDGPAGQARGARLLAPDGRTIYLFEDPAEPLP